MLRVKTGVFAIDFIEQSELESFLDRIRFFHDVEWQVYTSLPGSKLNGGRPNTFIVEDDKVYTTVPPYHVKGMKWGNIKDLEKKTLTAINRFNERGIGVGLTLTNHFIHDNDLNNPYVLHVLDLMARQSNKASRNDITYVDDKVRDFINERYGSSISLTASTIKFCAEPNFTYIDGLKQADNIVLIPQDGFNDVVLNSIPLEERHRVFVLTNSGCRRECDTYSANRHYTVISRFNEGMIPGVDYGCMFEDSANPCNIYDEHLQELIEKGYTSFKLGRLDYKGGMAEFSSFYHAIATICFLPLQYQI